VRLDNPCQVSGETQMAQAMAAAHCNNNRPAKSLSVRRKTAS
jgi:hypothetical protein